jgi:hypothetical protein
MKSLNYSIHINAPKKIVWEKMLEDTAYREWTKVFNPAGSYFEGSWNEGSKILFLGVDPETGKRGGMVSRIAKNKMHEFISIEHLGEVNGDIEDTTSEKVKSWQGSLENYIFTDKDDGTDLSVELSVPEDFKDYMDGAWPKALATLKEMCEK